MGTYLNPGAGKLQQSRNSEIYVDKSGMLSYLNHVINTEQRFVCVSRPRRFGKSMSANLISAYYDYTANGKELFMDMEIAEDESFARHVSNYNVLKINMQEFLSRTDSMDALLNRLRKIVLRDLMREYKDIDFFDTDDLIECMQDVYAETQRQFIVIIDEWDCIFREEKNHKEQQDQYLDFLRDWLKDKEYIALAYMTGILPIKKYGTHSALNMFSEFSMLDQGRMAVYTGFTEDEVKELCTRYNMDFIQTKEWYDGYRLEGCGEVYSPRSVVQSMLMGKFNNYWNQTETFEALRVYIDMNYDGLRDAILTVMAGGRVEIDSRSFVNDMVTFHSADDVLTLLVHLGYLGYDEPNKEIFVPNKEIMDEFVTATTRSEWSEVMNSIKKSKALLKATLEGDEAAVAQGIATAHLETSHIQYNDENALSYTLSLAYYAAREHYQMIRELPAGKGFADIVFIPKKRFADRPAIVVELKWNHDAHTALSQIRENNYPQVLQNLDYKEIILVGVSYDKKTREHSCIIEKNMYAPLPVTMEL